MVVVLFWDSAGKPTVASQWISVDLGLSLAGIVLGNLPAPCALLSGPGVLYANCPTSLRAEVPA